VYTHIHMASEQAQAKLHKVLLGDGATSGGAAVADILVVAHQVN
jgi:hypothetical protein